MCVDCVQFCRTRICRPRCCKYRGTRRRTSNRGSHSHSHTLLALYFTSLHFISVTLASFDSIILYAYTVLRIYNLSTCTVFLLCYSDLRYASSLLLLYCTVLVSSRLVLHIILQYRRNCFPMPLYSSEYYIPSDAIHCTEYSISHRSFSSYSSTVYCTGIHYMSK